MASFRVRIAPEYCAGPLWWDDGQYGPVERGQLPISARLADDLKEWQEDYDATLDWDDPRQARFVSAAAESAWHDRGDALLARLRAELGDQTVTRYQLPPRDWPTASGREPDNPTQDD